MIPTMTESPRDLIVSTVIPVSDMARSREFYEQAVGLTGEPAPGGHILHAGAGTRLFLLDGSESYAGQAGWPLASFLATDLAATVAVMHSRGVIFDIMDGDPYQTDERGIADFGTTLIAWFRDPDNQVISIVQPT